MYIQPKARNREKSVEKKKPSKQLLRWFLLIEEFRLIHVHLIVFQSYHGGGINMFGGAVAGYGMAGIIGGSGYKCQGNVVGFFLTGIAVIQGGIANGYGKGLEIFLCRYQQGIDQLGFLTGDGRGGFKGRKQSHCLGKGEGHNLFHRELFSEGGEGSGIILPPRYHPQINLRNAAGA